MPAATTRASAIAAAQSSAPVASAIQVAASISTTLGGVPRVWPGPPTTCTAPNGGTRTSTECPGAFSASSCSRYRVASAVESRSPSPRISLRMDASPTIAAIFAFAMPPR